MNYIRLTNFTTRLRFASPLHIYLMSNNVESNTFLRECSKTNKEHFCIMIKHKVRKNVTQ